MKSHEVRNRFVKYFEKHGHDPVPSSSLIPQNDPTLLFANAGMNQFKNVFLGLEKRENPRAVTVQKCVRAGGKHNDLENVGHTARHHTFFEMLGNFSFGDYFKKEAIHFAWELLTKEYQILKDRLYVTVFETDDEAAEIWHKQEGVPKDRIYRFGEKDNFWRMGETGPCGPCSEIFYDHGPEVGPNEKMGDDGDRFVEIWNLVFMQFNEDENGKLNPLPRPSVDTGSGLERVAAALQGESNNYNTDIFIPLIRTACEVARTDYVTDEKVLAKDPSARETTAALRVVADHARAVTFLIADGVLPSNEGRGYVLRRILRRAIRYARNLSEDSQLFSLVVRTTIEEMKAYYPYLTERSDLITRTVQDEVDRFLTTLDQGTEILNQHLKSLSKGDALSGDVAFKLYDTFGFPVDLTRLMAVEKGFQVNEAEFEQRMEEARKKAKASWKGKGPTGNEQHLIQWTSELVKKHGATSFTGYETTNSDGKVLSLSNGEASVDSLKAGETGFVLFDRTPFYAEGGGQIGDSGELTWDGGRAEVTDCRKQNQLHVLELKITQGVIKRGQTANQQVEDSRRRATANNHSATHLLHSALRKVLGTHVTQAGSLVDPVRLRFDFTHKEPLSAGQIQEIEDLVNNEISKALPVESKVVSYDEAVKGGALALFGEKYEDEVRVITMGPFSMELCGGTHVANTAFIRAFQIVSETGVSSGVRRIEAVTGDGALAYLIRHKQDLRKIEDALHAHESWTRFMDRKAEDSPALAQVGKLREEIKNLQRSLKSIQSGQLNLDEIIARGQMLQANGKQLKLVVETLDVDDRKLLSELSDQLRDKIQTGVVILVGKASPTYPMIISVTKNLLPKVHAGKLLQAATSLLEGKGGGRPDFAQGAVPKIDRLDEAISAISREIES